jgi:5-formyltetrahydrofolate cyclo-ligase
MLSLWTDKEKFYSKQNSIIEQLENCKEFTKAKNIGTYYPLTGEFDLSSMIIANNQKNWAIPRPIGNSIMIFFEVSELHELIDTSNSLKVPKPINKVIKASELDLVIVPALAYDKNFYRLGRGGGYYDNLLTKLNKNCKIIGVCSKELIIDNLPIEDHDRAVDKIITA